MRPRQFQKIHRRKVLMEVIRKQAKLQGVRLIDIAELLDYSTSHICKLLAGEVSMRMDEYLKLLNYLQLDLKIIER